MSLAVLIPTFRRNASLERALRSVFAQTLAPDEIIIVDNAPEGGARALAETLKGRSPCPLVYVHAAEPGVANARNAGFAATKARFIAQLDDDESAAPDWLEALMNTRARFDAAVVFGPVRAEAHAPGRLRAALMRRLYSREPALEDGVIAKPWGCGNSLIDRQVCVLPDPPFDASANETGGEDDLLFSALGRGGARFVWAGKAQVSEHVEGARAAWRHLLRRSFAYGQGATQACLAGGRRNYAGAAFWMTAGAGQALVYALAFPAARLLGARAGAACLDRMVQGAGKLVWIDALSPRFYGAAKLARAG